jgi:hypothetical protein
MRLTAERLAEIRAVVAEGGNILVEDVVLLLREVDALTAERDELQENLTDAAWILGDRAGAINAAEAREQTLRAALEKIDRVYEGLRLGEHDGEFDLWSEDDLVRALHGIRAVLAGSPEPTAEIVSYEHPGPMVVLAVPSEETTR